jgi:hypothetical protein
LPANPMPGNKSFLINPLNYGVRQKLFDFERTVYETGLWRHFISC